MVQRNDNLRRKIAEHFLQNPRHTHEQARVALGLTLISLRYYIYDIANEKSLKRYGGAYATPEHIAEVLQYGLKVRRLEVRPQRGTKREVLTSTTSRAIAPVIPSIPIELRDKVPMLRADQCQWLLSLKDPPFYCCKKVAKLYCSAHDVLAKEAEDKRFAKAQGV